MSDERVTIGYIGSDGEMHVMSETAEIVHFDVQLDIEPLPRPAFYGLLRVPSVLREAGDIAHRAWDNWRRRT